MVKFKTIRIKKRGGGTRSQRVQVLASGKYKFVKNPGRSSSPSRTGTRKPRSRSVRRMARRKRRSRRGGVTIPLAVVVPVGATVAKTAQHYMQYQDPFGALSYLCGAYTGYRPDFGDFQAGRMMEGTVPLLIGTVVHKVVGGMLGVNRILGRAKIPFLRI